MRLFSIKNPETDAKLLRAQYAFNNAVRCKSLSAGICSSYLWAMVDSSKLTLEMLDDALAVTRAMSYYLPEIYEPALKALLKLSPDTRTDSEAIKAVAEAIETDAIQHGLSHLITEDLVDAITTKCNSKARLPSSPIGDECVAYGKPSVDDDSDEDSVGLSCF